MVLPLLGLSIIAALICAALFGQSILQAIAIFVVVGMVTLFAGAILVNFKGRLFSKDK